jgi:hypothetical protein
MVEPKRRNELLSSNQSRVLVDLNLVNRAKLPYLRPFGPLKRSRCFYICWSVRDGPKALNGLRLTSLRSHR